MTKKMTEAQFQEFLEAALKWRAEASQADKLAGEAALARVHARLTEPLPRQKAPLWRLPAVLLDWQFAPAWPRLAALAGCAALGFVIGIAGLDRNFDGQGAPFAATNRTDLGSIVFEPEALTGARP